MVKTRDARIIDAQPVTVTVGEVMRWERENALLRAVADPAQRFHTAWHDWHEELRGVTTEEKIEAIGQACRTAYREMGEALARLEAWRND